MPAKKKKAPPANETSLEKAKQENKPKDAGRFSRSKTE